MATCQSTIISPSLQNLESGAWTLFALRTPDSEFCEDGLMMVNWRKHAVKIKKKVNILLCLTKTRICFVAF